MPVMKVLNSRAEWLQARAGRIGGSEIASVVGMNPWQTNVELWEIKTGRRKGGEISNDRFVEYGRKSEKYLRELFKLDFQQYGVHYVENNIWYHEDYPFAHASLDGWLKDEEGRFGVLEIKTTNIVNAQQKLKWFNRIPDNYFCQVIWYMAVTEAEFAVLLAQQKWDRDGDVFKVIKHYHIEREEVEDDIEYLLKHGEEFYHHIMNDTEPPLILPSI